MPTVGPGRAVVALPAEPKATTELGPGGVWAPAGAGPAKATAGAARPAARATATTTRRAWRRELGRACIA